MFWSVWSAECAVQRQQHLFDVNRMMCNWVEYLKLSHPLSRASISLNYAYNNKYSVMNKWAADWCESTERAQVEVLTNTRARVFDSQNMSQGELFERPQV